MQSFGKFCAECPSVLQHQASPSSHDNSDCRVRFEGFFCLSVYLSVTGFPHTCVLSSYGHMELHVSKSPEDTTTKICKMYPESIYWNTTNKSYARGKSFSCNKYRRFNNNITIAHSKPLKFTELLGLEIRGQIRLLSWLLLFQILILTTESSVSYVHSYENLIYWIQKSPLQDHFFPCLEDQA